VTPTTRSWNLFSLSLKSGTSFGWQHDELGRRQSVHSCAYCVGLRRLPRLTRAAASVDVSMFRVRNCDTRYAKMKSPCPAALGDRKSPAEAGLSNRGDPNVPNLELRYRVPHGLGGAPEAGGLKPPRCPSWLAGLMAHVHRSSEKGYCAATGEVVLCIATRRTPYETPTCLPCDCNLAWLMQ